MAEDTSENWLERLNRGSSSNTIRTFDRSDISLQVQLHGSMHLILVLQNHFGLRSLKLEDRAFKEMVAQEHERIRKKVMSEANPLITSFFCSLATFAGFTSNDGGGFQFRHIADDVAQEWSYRSLARFFFVIRASWDDNPLWILKAEEKVMSDLSILYEDGFIPL